MPERTVSSEIHTLLSLSYVRRQSKDEGNAGIITSRPHSTSLCFDEVLDDRKTQASTAGGTLARRIGAVKAIEYVCDLVSGEAAACVVNLHHYFFLPLSATHCNNSVGRGASGCVAE